MKTDTLALKSLFEVDEKNIIDLMNHPLVGKYLPLLVDIFTREDCQNFLSSKQKLWDDFAYGPWAIRINDEFAGWGGLQAENGEADFALVLHPKFWGYGRQIFSLIKTEAFEQLHLDSITALLPETRTNARAITRLGFIKENRIQYLGKCFIRYRLKNQSITNRRIGQIFVTVG